MKGPIFIITALYLVLKTSAADVPLPIVNYEVAVDDLIKEAQDISSKTAQTLEVQYKSIVVEPLDQVDTEVQKIEHRREEDANCVSAKDADVELVVGIWHDDLNVCGVSAGKTSTNIINDVNEAMQQLIFDGYDVVKLNQKCKHYKNSVLKNSCYAKLTVKGTLYLKNARQSIKTIKAANQRVPDVFVEANKCTHSSAEKAVIELDSIQTEVDSCIVSKKYLIK